MAGLRGTCDEWFSAVRKALARDLDDDRGELDAREILGSDCAQSCFRALYDAVG